MTPYPLVPLQSTTYPRTIEYRYQTETLDEAHKLPPGTVNAEAHRVGLLHGEPLIIALDALLRYAKAYKVRMEAPLADDNILAEPWRNAVDGIRALLDGDGALALERNISTDSKDNGALAELADAALNIAGFLKD